MTLWAFMNNFRITMNFVA